MASRDHEFCRLYLRTADVSVPAQVLSRVLKVPLDRHTLDVGGLTVDLLRNDGATSATTEGSDFVQWPVTAEIEADASLTDDDVRDRVAQLLAALWDANISTVAACDFEEELPWSGGIQRL